MIAVAYTGGFFSEVSGVSRSNGLMTARITLVATCVNKRPRLTPPSLGKSIA